MQHALTDIDKQIIDTLECRRVYWQAGQPKGCRFVAEVNDPPCGGWQSALFLRLPDGDFSVFCPYSMRHFIVSPKSQEYAASIPDTLPKQWFIDLIKRKWHYEHADLQMASYFLRAMGAEPPEIVQSQVVEEKRQGGKEPAAKLSKQIKKGTKKSEIFEYFWSQPGMAIDAAAEWFKTTRSNILSHLFCIHRDHGVGYEITGDRVKMLLTLDETFPIQTEGTENA